MGSGESLRNRRLGSLAQHNTCTMIDTRYKFRQITYCVKPKNQSDVQNQVLRPKIFYYIERTRKYFHIKSFFPNR